MNEQNHLLDVELLFLCSAQRARHHLLLEVVYLSLEPVVLLCPVLYRQLHRGTGSLWVTRLITAPVHFWRQNVV